ncbi:DM9 repeat-containing protein, partial [Enterococcus hirae]|uniref:DM9 repeat-containing protein n=1 Tax=Enterococcus hirae TaxID=1354 RepID=UPI0019642289
MPYRWQAAQNGSIPEGAVPHGREATGEPLWICRVKLAGGLHLGKVRPGLGAASIAYGGTETEVSAYEVLMDAGEWQDARDGEVPAYAYVAGREGDGWPLYAARVRTPDGGTHPGKVRREFGAANVGWNGQEHKFLTYQVLVHPGSEDHQRTPREEESSAPTTAVTLREAEEPAAVRSLSEEPSFDGVVEKDAEDLGDGDAEATQVGGIHALATEDHDTVLADGIAVVVFRVNESPACQRFQPQLEEFSRRNPDLPIWTVEAMAQRALSERHHLQALPTTVIYREGLPLRRFAGGLS